MQAVKGGPPPQGRSPTPALHPATASCPLCRRAALAPVVLVGPLLGVLGVWYRDHGDLPHPVKQLTGEVPAAVHGVLHRVLRAGAPAAGPTRPPAAAARSPPRQQQQQQRRQR